MRDLGDIADRKRRHLELAASEDAVRSTGAGWADVHLIPCPVPDFSLADVDLGCRFLGHRLRAPIVIAGMTGGHPAAAEINARLGEAAQRLGLAVGVGSQRAALRNPALAPTYAAIRRNAPHAVVLANVGASQLVHQHDGAPLGPPDLRHAVAMVDAQALAVHLNVLEEHIQPEGNRNASGWLAALAAVVEACPVPVVVKETGGGMSRPSAGRFADLGVAALDVGGAGGTSFARIEAVRAREAGDLQRARLGETFGEWGLATAASILEARGGGLPMIATGGIRNGLDAAKALALGADFVGIARIALKAAQQGLDMLLAELEHFIEELRLALLLCGARTPEQLALRPPVLTGLVEAWARQRPPGEARLRHGRRRELPAELPA